MMDLEEKMRETRIAEALGISIDELDCLNWQICEDSSSDGLVYNYRIIFADDNDVEILKKIDGLERGRYVYLNPWELDSDGEDQDRELELELEWEIESLDQSGIFNSHLESIETLLDLHLDQQTTFNLLVMLHGHVIASIEQYLSSIIIHEVTNSDDLTRKLIETDRELGKKQFALKDIYLHHGELKKTVAAHLKSQIFHKMDKVKPMFESVLGFKFGDISWLFKAIIVRHHCVHRAGYDMNGNKVTISAESIRDLLNKSRLLVGEIEIHVNQW